MLQQSLAVFIVLGLLLAALSLLRRKGIAAYGFAAALKELTSRNAGRRLQVIERLALTPQHSLHLVSIGDHLVVFATSPTGCERIEAPPLICTLAEGVATALKNGASC